MPRYKRGRGRVYRQVKVGEDGKKQILKPYWLDYVHQGKRVRESAGTTDKDEAENILQSKIGARAEGRLVVGADKVTFGELAQDLVEDYEINKRKSLDKVLIRLKKHLLPHFGSAKAHDITEVDVKRFMRQRQKEKASDAEINRELAALKRAFNLGIGARKIHRKPPIKMLPEDNVRQGFFERAEFDRLLAKLPDELRPVVTLGYLTGWRIKSEILALKWSQVDLRASAVRLWRGQGKTREPRLIVLFPEMTSILELQWADHLTRYPDCPWVFHRAGKPIKNFRGAWDRACREADLKGKIPHDFRRSAARNLLRAGISEDVAMQITGHKTREVFRRYKIVNEADMRDAAEKMRALYLIEQGLGHTLRHTSQEEQPLSH